VGTKKAKPSVPSKGIKPAKKSAHSPEDDEMPTQEEADEAYQETLYEQGCMIVEEMSDKTRQMFFTHLEPGKGAKQPEKTIRSVRADLVVPKSIKWLVKDRWAVGFACYVDGETTAGKSTVLCEEIAALTKLGINCGVVNLEDPIDSVVVPRLIAAGADLSRVYIFQPGEEENELTHLALPRDIPAIEKWAEANGLRFIVIDPAVGQAPKRPQQRPGGVKGRLESYSTGFARAAQNACNNRHATWSNSLGNAL
jgi:hypothetical protein